MTGGGGGGGAGGSASSFPARGGGGGGGSATNGGTPGEDGSSGQTGNGGSGGNAEPPNGDIMGFNPLPEWSRMWWRWKVVGREVKSSLLRAGCEIHETPPKSLKPLLQTSKLYPLIE